MNSFRYFTNRIDTKLATKYNGWLDFPSGINLHSTLLGGQSFRWRSIEDGFIGVMHGLLWFVGTAPSDDESSQYPRMFYRVLAGTPRAIQKEDFQENIKRYFSYDVDVDQLKSEWKPILGDLFEKNPTLNQTCLLTQEPFETVISFICSANNNISRITTMVNSFSRFYGERLFAVDENLPDNEAVLKILNENEDLMYAFPEVDGALANINEMQLVDAKYGYRAKYIVNTLPIYKNAKFPDEYEDLLIELQKLSGVGPKVADCIALMGFGKTEAVPLDTHMLQITKRLFPNALPASLNNNAKTLTHKAYKELGTWYRETFGPMAGWAQLWLFIANLQRNQTVTIKKRIITEKSLKREVKVEAVEDDVAPKKKTLVTKEPIKTKKIKRVNVEEGEAVNGRVTRSHVPKK